MKRTPIEKEIILDLTDEAAMRALQMGDKMRETCDGDPYSEHSIKMKQEHHDLMVSLAINNPKNWQPEKYQRRPKSPKNSGPSLPAEDPPF